MKSNSNPKTFRFSFPSRDVESFRVFCKQLDRFKNYGRVCVEISGVSGPARFEMPPGGSGWHEYASYNSSFCKYFPHPKIAKHLPADWVKKNRDLLLAKAKIVRDAGFTASFSGHEPCFLPESFFKEFPHLRGPRIDHPRRGRHEEFAPCVDLDETLAMYEWMACEFKRNVPELEHLSFTANDAGSGLCWAANQYPGPNGPRHCQRKSVGPRVSGFLEAIARGAEKGGGAVEVCIGNFGLPPKENELIAPFLAKGWRKGVPPGKGIGVPTLFGNNYPVLGLIDPVAILEAMEPYSQPDLTTVSCSFGTMYRRTIADRLDACYKVMEIVEDVIREPVSGYFSRLERLRRLAREWAGEAKADAVAEAFLAIHDAFCLRQAVAPEYSVYYNGLSMRYLTRPLVIKPDLLTPEEEAYFLPYVFNIHLNEARMDYIDLHGGRIDRVEIVDPFRAMLAKIRDAAKVLEEAADTPEREWLKRLAVSWRLWTSIMRSCHNFFFGQQIRDRNKDVLAGEPRIPSKVGTSTGHPDILPWNELMRDEFDNTQETLALLEGGGQDLVFRAASAEEEDTFLLGPDLTGALKKKCEIMRAHWLDVEKYLATPYK